MSTIIINPIGFFLCMLLDVVFCGGICLATASRLYLGILVIQVLVYLHLKTEDKLTL